MSGGMLRARRSAPSDWVWSRPDAESATTASLGPCAHALLGECRASARSRPSPLATPPRGGLRRGSLAAPAISLTCAAGRQLRRRTQTRVALEVHRQVETTRRGWPVEADAEHLSRTRSRASSPRRTEGSGRARRGRRKDRRHVDIQRRTGAVGGSTRAKTWMRVPPSLTRGRGVSALGGRLGGVVPPLQKGDGSNSMAAGSRSSRQPITSRAPRRRAPGVGRRGR